ncbi:YSIRK-type signal peptide-containing protein [Ligilactobacillus saerimneri]|uniref:YSIRK-type signal peptide-containing protein n=1 Tax=Ligilactobacillus saerimneri TaxID=228229 RepID=A0A7H9EJM6_9LACO|nr:YSIRK-type signal peptide-containing protein [Ligilactobacillus saerimneri]QLL77442.1 YSIRK-type signal peptide-containing protein [Ligilactobacillus saerimneri]
MVGRNNFELKKIKTIDQTKTYALRKLTVGTASVLLGTTFFFAGAKGAAADTTTTTTAAQEVTTKSTNTVTTATTTAPTGTNSGTNTSTVGSDQTEQDTTSTGANTANTNKASAKASSTAPATTTAEVTNAGAVSDSVQDSKAVSANSTSTPSAANTAAVTNTAAAATTTVTPNVSSDGLVATDDQGRTLSINQKTLGNDGIDDGITVRLNGTFNTGDIYTVKIPQSIFGVNDSGVTAAGALAGIGNLTQSTETINGVKYNVYQINFTNSFTTGSQGLYWSLPEYNNYRGWGKPDGSLINGSVLREIYWSHTSANDSTVIANPTLTYDRIINTSFNNPQIQQMLPSGNVKALVPGNEYSFQVATNQTTGIKDNSSYPAAKINSAMNYGATITIYVPAGFKLDVATTRLRSNMTDSDPTTITQPDGAGGDVIITVPKGAGRQAHESSRGYWLTGEFTTIPDETTTFTAAPGKIEELIMTTSGLQTITADLNPWQVTILGKNAVPTEGSFPINVFGNRSQNTFIQTVKTKIANYFSVVNDTALDFDNNLHILATFPNGLDVTGIKVPGLDATNRPGTTYYTYTAIMTDGTVLTGRLDAGATFTAPDGKLLAKIELIPNFWAVGASSNRYVNYYWYNNFGTNQWSDDGTFLVYGTLSKELDEANPLPNNTTVKTSLTVWSSAFRNGTIYTVNSVQGVVSSETLKASLTVSSKQTDNKYPDIEGTSAWNIYGELGINPGRDKTGNDFVYEPIFYYVLPQGTNYAKGWDEIRNKNSYNGTTATPKLTKFVVDGREVIKVDYTGTGYMFYTGRSSNTMDLTINVDADAGVFPWEVYMFTRTGMADGTTKISNPTTEQNNFTQNIVNSRENGSLYLIGSGDWEIKNPQIAYLPNTAQGNQDPMAVQDGKSDDKGSTDMSYHMVIVNHSVDTLQNGYVVANLPQASDTSFTFQLSGPVVYEQSRTELAAGDYEVLYSTALQTMPSTTDKNYLPSTAGFVTADQVTDWSQIKSLLIHFLVPVQGGQVIGQFVLHGTDPTLATDAGKTGYLDSALMGYGFTPFVSRAAAITVTGQSTVTSRVHYQDENGADYYLDVPTMTKIYNDNIDTMKADDFKATDVPSDIIPAGYELVATPTIVNANGTTAAFGQKVTVGFDGAVVQFESRHKIDTVTKQVNLTDNFVYAPTAPLYQKDGDNRVVVDGKRVDAYTKGYTVVMQIDEVTGAITYYLQDETGQLHELADGILTIPGTDAPVVVGYTPDTNERATVQKALSVNLAQEFAKGTDDGLTFTNTVTYTADAQSLTYTVIDHNTGQTVVLQPTAHLADGVTDQATDNATLQNLQAIIAHYEANGYRLQNVTYYDKSQGKFVTVDQAAIPATFAADASQNNVQINLVHATKLQAEYKQVTRTINYWDADTQKLLNTANAKLSANTYPQTIHQTVDFTRYAVYDQTTHSLVGYYAPDQVQINADGSLSTLAGAQMQTASDSGWQVSSAADRWNYVVNYDLTPYGYEAPVAAGNVSLPAIAAQDVTAQTADQTVNVYYHQKWVDVTPDNPPTPGKSVDPQDSNSPEYPANDYNDHLANLTNTSTRTIHYIYAPGTHREGKDVSGQAVEGLQDVVQTVKFYRLIRINLVTGELLFHDEWLPASSTTVGQKDTTTTANNSDYALVDSPTYRTGYDVLRGYTPHERQVSALTATPGQDVGVVNVEYVSNDSLAQISYYDADSGTTIVVDEVSGKSGDPLHYTTAERIEELEKQGYELVSDDFTTNPQGLNKDYLDAYNTNGIPDVINQVWRVTLKHKKVAVTADDPKETSDKITDGDGYSADYPTGVSQTDLNAAAQRTINFVYSNKPAGQNEAFPPVTQTVNFTRQATIDLVLLKQGRPDAVTYSSWTPQGTDDPQFATYAVENIPGYTVNHDIVTNAKIVRDEDGKPVNGRNHTVIYTPNTQSTDIVFVDKDGRVVTPTYPIIGQTDQTVAVPDNVRVPNGWKLVTGEKIPETITFTGSGTPEIRIKVEHATAVVTPDNPKTPADSLPDNPDRNYPNGVGFQDLHRTVKRTVNVHMPDETVKTLVQTTTFERQATVDEVNGMVTYGEWNLAQGSTNHFSPVAATDLVETPAGYTPTAPAAEVIGITPDTKDMTVDIHYTANDQTAHLTLIDEDNNGQSLGSLTGNGKFGTKIFFNQNGTSLQDVLDKLSAANYAVDTSADNFQAGTVYHSDNNQNEYRIYLKHKTATTYRTKEVNEVIHYVYANENQTPAADDYVAEPLTFVQDGTTDLVTEVTTWNSKWTRTHDFATVTSPEVQGYTPNQVEVGSVTVSLDAANFVTAPTTIEKTVVYHGNPQTVVVSYYDDDLGQVVGSEQTMTGRTGETLTVTPTIPENYVLVPGYPEMVTLTADGNHNGEQIVVHLKHAQQQVQRVKTVTRTINYYLPTGTKTVTQTLTFTQTGTQDLVTNQVIWDAKWQAADQFAALMSPTVANYVADQTEVAAAQIQVTAQNWYENLDQTVAVHYAPRRNDSITSHNSSSSTAVVAPPKVNQQITQNNEQHRRTAHPTTDSTKAQTTLPQTGDDQTNFGIWGMLLLAVAGLFGVVDKKKRHD